MSEHPLQKFTRDCRRCGQPTSRKFANKNDGLCPACKAEHMKNPPAKALAHDVALDKPKKRKLTLSRSINPHYYCD